MRLPASHLLVLALAAALAGCSAPDAPAEGATSEGGADAPSSPSEGSPAATPPSGSPTGGASEDGTPLARPPSHLGYGVALSPATGDASGLASFFDEARALGGVVLWDGDAATLADTQGAADVAAQLARQEGLVFGAQVDVYAEGVAFDAARQEKLRHDVVAYAERAQPAFLVLGAEVDRIARHDPAFVDAYAAWYSAAYDAVKEASPATLVFPSFQLENMRGFTGALFGGPESSPPLWDLLDKFPKRDFTAFSTYPALVFQAPNAIPSDYYARAAEEAGGPIAFTNVGYFVDDVAPDWESSPEEQAQFVQRFFSDVSKFDVRLALWAHLHDQPQAERAPFQSMGLVGQDGAKRAAYDAWVAGVADAHKM